MFATPLRGVRCSRRAGGRVRGALRNPFRVVVFRFVFPPGSAEHATRGWGTQHLRRWPVFVPLRGITPWSALGFEEVAFQGGGMFVIVGSCGRRQYGGN